ncbi:hypothetical protein AAK706_13045 [Erysipelotrichaceae bacterium 66-17]
MDEKRSNNCSICLLEMAKNFSFSISLSGWPAAVAIVSISIATLGCFAITLGKNI